MTGFPLIARCKALLYCLQITHVITECASCLILLELWTETQQHVTSFCLVITTGSAMTKRRTLQITLLLHCIQQTYVLAATYILSQSHIAFSYHSMASHSQLLCSSTKRRTIEFNGINIKQLQMLSHEQETQWTNMITPTDFSKFSVVPYLPDYVQGITSQKTVTTSNDTEEFRFRYKKHRVYIVQTHENRRKIEDASFFPHVFVLRISQGDNRRHEEIPPRPNTAERESRFTGIHQITSNETDMSTSFKEWTEYNSLKSLFSKFHVNLWSSVQCYWRQIIQR